MIQLLFANLFSKHGTPSTILDRDPLFTAKHFKGVTDLLDIRKNMATTGHPQTDGQSENTIRMLSQMLRNCIQQKPKAWDTLLSELEFEYNSSRHKSTISPIRSGYRLYPTNRAHSKFDFLVIRKELIIFFIY